MLCWWPVQASPPPHPYPGRPYSPAQPAAVAAQSRPGCQGIACPRLPARRWCTCLTMCCCSPTDGSCTSERLRQAWRAWRKREPCGLPRLAQCWGTPPPAPLLVLACAACSDAAHGLHAGCARPRCHLRAPCLQWASIGDPALLRAPAGLCVPSQEGHRLFPAGGRCPARCAAPGLCRAGICPPGGNTRPPAARAVHSGPAVRGCCRVCKPARCRRALTALPAWVGPRARLRRR